MQSHPSNEALTVEALEAMPQVGTRWIGEWEFVRYVSEGESVWTARKRQDFPEIQHGPAGAATIVALCLGQAPPQRPEPEDRLSRSELRAAFHPQL